MPAVLGAPAPRRAQPAAFLFAPGGLTAICSESSWAPELRSRGINLIGKPDPARQSRIEWVMNDTRASQGGPLNPLAASCQASCLRRRYQPHPRPTNVATIPKLKAEGSGTAVIANDKGPPVGRGA